MPTRAEIQARIDAVGLQIDALAKVDNGDYEWRVAVAKRHRELESQIRDLQCQPVDGFPIDFPFDMLYVIFGLLLPRTTPTLNFVGGSETARGAGVWTPVERVCTKWRRLVFDSPRLYKSYLLWRFNKVFDRTTTVRCIAPGVDAVAHLVGVGLITLEGWILTAGGKTFDVGRVYTNATYLEVDRKPHSIHCTGDRIYLIARKVIYVLGFDLVLVRLIHAPEEGQYFVRIDGKHTIRLRYPSGVGTQSLYHDDAYNDYSCTFQIADWSLGMVTGLTDKDNLFVRCMQTEKDYILPVKIPGASLDLVAGRYALATPGGVYVARGKFNRGKVVKLAPTTKLHVGHNSIRLDGLFFTFT